MREVARTVHLKSERCPMGARRQRRFETELKYIFYFIFLKSEFKQNFKKYGPTHVFAERMRGLKSCPT